MKDKEKQIFDKYGNYDFPTEIKQDGLNTATTQIEEMASIIKSVKYEPFNDGKPTYTVGNQMQDFVFDLIAEELLKHYQPRFPQDSVVLEDRERFRARNEELKETAEQLRQEIITLSQELVNSRKETAEKILKWLKKSCAFYGFEFVEAYFKEQFGVEVDK